MSERRSSRSKNAVKYAGFDEDSDDDFAVSHHPSKKAKTSKKDEATKKNKKVARDKWDVEVDIVDSSLIKPHTSNKTRRGGLSDKVYERELQEALELSLIETGGSQDDVNKDKDTNMVQPETPASDGGNHQKVLPESVSDHKLQTKVTPDNTATKLVPNLRCTLGTVVVDDSIELLEEGNDGTNIQRDQKRISSRNQTSKAYKIVDSGDESNDESNFKPGADSDGDESSGNSTDADMSDDDDDDAESDVEFNSKKTAKTKPKLNKNKANTQPSKPFNSRTQKAALKKQLVKPRIVDDAIIASTSSPKICATKPTSERHAPNKTIARSTVGTMLSHPCQKIPSSLVSHWKPPSLASPDEKSLTLAKSPSSGLRLGLSRNQRVKPLHPSVKVV